MSEVNGIILAAGLSTRMGDRNKLLLDIGGRPMISHLVRTYSAVITGKLVVVTGYQHDCVAKHLRGLPVEIVYNPRYDEGQPFSVAAGLSEMSGDGPTILGLGDQPTLRASDLRWLLSQHRLDPDRGPDGARGNPIVIPSAMRAQMLANPKSLGCRKFTRDNPDLVTMVPTAAPGFFADIDTPEDYDRIAAHQLRTAGAAS